jgi:glutathione S-transferase
MSLKLSGINLSPYVRKVRVVLAEKGLDYDHEPLMPFGLSDEYAAKHPLKKIPLLEDGDKVIPDSSAICAYLEDIAPTPALYPSDAYDRARALWYEELADDGISAATGAFFRENLLAPLMFKRETDQAQVDKARDETLPPLFDYLERQLGHQEYLVGNAFSIADIAVASQIVNLRHGKGDVDADRWPKLAAWVERVHTRPSFKGLIEEEQAGIKAMGG